MVATSRKPLTLQDFLARLDSDRMEYVGGEVVEKAAPSPSHSLAEIKLGAAVDPFNRKPGPRGPGGWWIFTEIHVRYPAGEIFCHDAAGWRRDRFAARPTEWPVAAAPDWVCEILSPKHERHDLVVKPRVLHATEVGYYWVLDPIERLLLVHRWSPDGYTVVQRAAAGERVRAEPFDAIELSVSELLGDDDDSE